MENQNWPKAIEEFRKAVFIEEEDAGRKRTYGTKFISYYPNREIGIAFFNLNDFTNAAQALRLSMNQAPSERGREYLEKAEARLAATSGVVDTDPPVITLTSPAQSAVTVKTSTIALKGNVDDRSGISGFFINNTPLQLQFDRTFTSEYALSPGANTVTIKAVDNNKNTAELSVTITREADKVSLPVVAKKVAPLITVTNPASQRGMKAVITEKSLDVRGIVQAQRGLYSVTVNDVEAELTQKGEFKATIRLAMGDNLVVIKAVDIDNAAAVDSFTVVRDEAGEVAAVNPLRKARRGADYALLFGGDQYKSWTPLLNPINDVRAIGKELKEVYGFEVEIVENASLETILNTLRRYRKMKFERGDQLLIYFAGHGHYDKEFKMGYIVANDSRIDDINKVTYLPHDVLRTMIDNIPSEHVLLLLDVCHGGTFDQQLASARGGMDDLYSDTERAEFVDRKMQYRTRKFISSGSENYVSDGIPGRHSPFTRRVLEALRTGGSGAGLLTVSQLYSYVERLRDRPHAGEFGSNEPGSDFLFIMK